jgi:hypothetical protein
MDSPRRVVGDKHIHRRETVGAELDVCLHRQMVDSIAMDASRSLTFE